MLFKEIIHIFLFLQLDGLYACFGSNKQLKITPDNSIKASTIKNKIIIPTENNCNVSYNGKFEAYYCQHNSTCSYHLVPINETHDQREIVCTCTKVSFILINRTSIGLNNTHHFKIVRYTHAYPNTQKTFKKSIDILGFFSQRHYIKLLFLKQTKFYSFFLRILVAKNVRWMFHCSN
jgi:hypothetical protein